MADAKIPAAVKLLRSGARTVEGLSNAQLDRAAVWAISNDPALASELDDEIEFRQSEF